MGHRKKAVAGLVGLDIGGTKIEGILWRAGRVVRAQRISTPKTRKQFFRALINLIEDLSAGYQFRGIGIALAGSLDTKKGILIRNTNLRFLQGADLFRPLKNKFHKPVRMGNDANCFLRGEVKYGQGRGRQHVIALTLGTGVGGGIYANGKFLGGAHDLAGELGRILLFKDRGKYLNLEDLVSSHGFHRLGLRDPLAVQNEALAGDAGARAIYRQIGEYLGLGLASLINIFDPEIIILGGGIANASRLFLPAALSAMKKYVVSPARGLPPVKVSRLKFAGALGAVSLLLQK